MFLFSDAIKRKVIKVNINVTCVFLQLHAHEFNTNVALYDLYAYAVKYNDQVRKRDYIHLCDLKML